MNDLNNEKKEDLSVKRENAVSSAEERQASGGGQASTPAGAGNGDRLVFHYSREHRLARANESVRRVYEEGYNLNKGFIKGLTGNAGLRSTFLVIIILCAALALISIFGPSSDSGVFCGAEATLSAFTFGENLFISLSIDKSENLSDSLPGMVVAELTVLDSEGGVLSAGMVTGWYSGEELTLRQSFPDYGGASVSAILSVIDTDEQALWGESEAAKSQAESLSLSAKIRRE